MKNIGFLISHKNNEKRRALFPADLAQIRHKENLIFETGYGESLGFTDEEYLAAGMKIAPREEVLKCEALVDVKLGDADYLDQLEEGKLMVGWAHSVQNINFTSNMLKKKHSVLAWENIYEYGRYIFYRNREVAGEAAILQGFRYCGKMPYDCKVAILGNGQTAKGAMYILTSLGAFVDVFPRKMEKTFRDMLNDGLIRQYDVLVNCVMWDTNRKDRLIYREDLKKLHPGTLIIDVSCDPYLEIETSHPTTIDDPVYEVDGIIHYAVDNTPAMYPYTVSRTLSTNFAKYVDSIVTGEYPENIEAAFDIKDGKIINQAIREFREARGVFCD